MNKKLANFNLQEFLRRFGILIYTGDPEGDWILIEDEVRELRQMGIIDDEEYTTAMIEIRKAKHS